MKRTIFATVLVGLGLLGACAEADVPDGATDESAWAAMADDDGCPGSGGCPKKAAEAPETARTSDGLAPRYEAGPSGEAHCVNCCSDDGFECGPGGGGLPPSGPGGGGYDGPVQWSSSACYNYCAGCTSECKSHCKKTCGSGLVAGEETDAAAWAARAALQRALDPYPLADGRPNPDYDPALAARLGAGPAGESDVVVGTDDRTDVQCNSIASGIPFNHFYTPLYVTSDGRRCSALNVTQTGYLLVPQACKANPGQPLGTALFGNRRQFCGSGGTHGDNETFQAESETLDAITPFMAVKMTVSPSSHGWTLAKWHASVTPQVNQVDEVLTVAHDGASPFYGKADADCRITSTWSGGAAGLQAFTDCDLGDPTSIGAGVQADFNGCVQAPNPPGGCQAGTGPTSPGVVPGRQVGVYGGTSGGRNVLWHPSAFLAPGRLFHAHCSIAFNCAF